MSPSTLFKNGTSGSQQTVTLDQSELLVLKNLASIFLSEDFPGSQLEELLRARASTSAPILDPIASPAPAFNTSHIRGAGVNSHPIASPAAGFNSAPILGAGVNSTPASFNYAHILDPVASQLATAGPVAIHYI